ncbi:MAG: DNA repair protein RecN [Flavobacteriaceae bacterium]|nr:DNA repair protein RecN [Flavobacteriaceae bacterium]
MLQSLTIKNYALIESLHVDFTKGLSIITGETGAGKSILLGALALILGKRADLTSLKNKNKKCIIEAAFEISNYHLTSFFKANDIDYESPTIIRREILPNGKSRAFINDTPILLNLLNELSEKLIDVHSQHQTVLLAKNEYQFYIIDSFSKNKKFLDSYTRGLLIYKKLKKELQEIEKRQALSQEQYDYNLHLFEELMHANLQIEEQEKLEQSLDKLNHSEEIKQNLLEALSVLNDEQVGVLQALNSLQNNFSKITSFSNIYKSLFSRIKSLKIELDDITKEIENQNEEVIYNPLEIENQNDRLQLIYNLQKKHKVETIEGLHKIKSALDLKVHTSANSVLTKKQNEIEKVSKQLDDLAATIHKKRQKAIPNFIKQLEQTLDKLEMSQVKFKFDLIQKDTFLSNGKDTILFLISTNKGADFTPLKKGPSGGEMSRIMLAIKTILSNYTNLPSLIFDEIDTGVSGEISNRIADLMQTMSENMQVISITHLPQIAAKGQQHYKVFKTEEKGNTITNIKLLDSQERINEIAEMLGGKTLTDSAVKHAEQLLNC